MSDQKKYLNRTYLERKKDEAIQATRGLSELNPLHGSAWIDTKDRWPRFEDGSGRIGNVIWLHCDGYVCEPCVHLWDWKGHASCPGGRVAWMRVPRHAKFY